MSLIKPFTIETKDESSDKKMFADFSYFKSPEAKITVPVDESVGDEEQKRRGRPPKKKNDPITYVPVDGNGNATRLSMLESTESYANTYNETDSLLKNAIGQIDILTAEVKGDMNEIRAAKTLKNKYGYITDMTASMSSLISTKIGAIKEINNTITHSHDLDLKRAKELKIDPSKEANDDKKIMDLYSAFVNTPVGTYGVGQPVLGPSIQDMMLPGMNMVRADISGGNDDMGYMNFMNNLTPEQNRMRLESNPNIETVVIFNQDNGQRYFDVIDKATGMSVPNYTRPDPFLLENTTIDVAHLIARNADIDRTFPLILVGSNQSMSEY